MPQGDPYRIVIFGVTGQIGQELVDRLDESEWNVADLIGVASPDSAGQTFTFRGEELDVASEWPVLKGRDLVFLASRGVDALEVVRECLRAEVACIDLTGAVAGQEAVPLPFEAEEAAGLGAAPLVAAASPTALAWAAVLRAVAGDGRVVRAVGTVLTSAAAHGRAGVVSLSEESIALFNQSSGPDPGPSGQSVAFDVIPGGLDLERVRGELARSCGDEIAMAISAAQVPTFVGEGASILIELDHAIDAGEVTARLGTSSRLSVVGDGPGSRGLVSVEDERPAPAGPTLRDAAGESGVLVGRIEAEPSMAEGHGWRLWLTMDPLRVAADHALEIGAARLGAA